jgi:hypothetical protein
MMKKKIKSGIYLSIGSNYSVNIIKFAVILLRADIKSP